MDQKYIEVSYSATLSGSVNGIGAKNAVLPIMASLIITTGKSTLYNVPCSADVYTMISLLECLGAKIIFNEHAHTLTIDTTEISSWSVPVELMNKMRASVLALGPLLARFARANIALPGGCSIGNRPIDLHLQSFEKMGATIIQNNLSITARVQKLIAQKIVLDYPSVGATENILMAAAKIKGTTTIMNAALEPEVMDLVTVLKKMGAKIQILPPATIEICGQDELKSIEHCVMMDRLEAGSLLCAAAISKGSLELPDAPAYALDIFLDKLSQMGHSIAVGQNGIGVSFHATQNPKAVSFKTGPYPSFPTDLQAPFMAVQTVAYGQSVVQEMVFENRFHHVTPLIKMGADILVEGNKAIINGVEQLHARSVEASDIRASCALVCAGLVAKGTTKIFGLEHWQRAYDKLDSKLQKLGANITVHAPGEFANESFIYTAQEKELY